jgi:membrane protease YdiL (CAAX protease family)
VIFLNVGLAAFTVGAFWAGVFVARSFGWKVDYSLTPLGFSRPRGGMLVGAGVGALVGAGAVVASMPVNLASAFVLDRLGYSTERMIQGPFMRALVRWVEESPGTAIPAIVLVVVIFGPAIEELVFRGAVFNGLYRLSNLASVRFGGSDDTRKTARRVSFALAALVSSAVFALLHLEPVLLPALLILAVALCALFERTGSLLPTFVAHATFNSFAVTLIILAGLGVFEIPM